MSTTQAKPAILNLEEAIVKFYEEVSPLLDPTSHKTWDGIKLKNREFLILQAGLHLVGHCIALLIYTLALNSSLQVVANLAARGKKELNYSSQGQRHIPITLIGGIEVRVPVVYKLVRKARNSPGRKRKVGQRGKSQGQGFYPMFVLLGIANGVSPLVRCLVTEAATQAPSFEQAKPRIAWLGLSFSKERIRRISEAFCQVGLAERAQRLADLRANKLSISDALKDKRVAIAVDGGRMNLRRTFKRGRKRKSGWPGYSTKWREPKLLIIYVLDEEGRKERCRQLPIVADGTLLGKEQFLIVLQFHLHQLGIQLAKSIVLLGDGARWIWQDIPPLLREIGCRQEQLTQILDHCHAVQHLYSVGIALFGKKEGHKWAKKWAKKLKKQSASALVSQLNTYLINQESQDLETLRKEYNYFHNHQTKGRLDYASFKKQQLPLGSGVVESLIRQTVNLRLKGSSKPWLPENGEAFLVARCRWAVHQWEHYCHAVLTFGLAFSVINQLDFNLKSESLEAKGATGKHNEYTKNNQLSIMRLRSDTEKKQLHKTKSCTDLDLLSFKSIK